MTTLPGAEYGEVPISPSRNYGMELVDELLPDPALSGSPLLRLKSETEHSGGPYARCNVKLLPCDPVWKAGLQ